jgi:F0F1-type ATP synthase assembly protein I
MVDFKKSAMRDGSVTRRRKRNVSIAQAYRTAHEVVSAALGIALFAGLGFWLDGRLNCKPALTICGAFLGFVSAGLTLRNLLVRLDRESAERKGQRSNETKARDK